jgi:hypothetical protein
MLAKLDNCNRRITTAGDLTLKNANAASAQTHKHQRALHFDAIKRESWQPCGLIEPVSIPDNPRFIKHRVVASCIHLPVCMRVILDRER